MPFIPSWSDVDRVRAELEVLRLNVSAHPLAFARHGVRRLRCVALRAPARGARRHAHPPRRRARAGADALDPLGHRTLFLTLEDETGMAEVVVFNDVFLRYGKLLKETVYLLVEGELQNNDERGLAIVAQRIFDLMAVLRDPGMLKRGAGGGRRAGGGPPNDGQSPVATPLGARPQWGPMAPDPRYPSPSPQDHRWPKADPAEGLDDLPVVEPRTRPGRTG